MREVPNSNEWTVLRRYLMEVHTELKKLKTASVPPRPVTNLTATAKSGGIIVMFTRTDGDSYILYTSPTPNLQGSTRLDLGKKGQYVDDIGKSNEIRYYWVRTKKKGLESVLSGPVFATTLALDVEITPPVRPPEVDERVFSDELGYPVEKI